MITKVEKLYDSLTINYACFENSVGFTKWINAIPDTELYQLAIKIDILEAFMRTERSHYEKIVRKKLLRTITHSMSVKTQQLVNKTSIDDRIQTIYDIYSTYFPMINLYRIENINKKFEKGLIAQVNVCNRLEKEMDEVVSPSRDRGGESKLKTLFQNIRDYTEQYMKEMVEYNRRRKLTLLLKTGMNCDVFRLIVSFMTMDQPPYSITV